jgi:hypothetical protein
VGQPQVFISLRHLAPSGVQVETKIGEHVYGPVTHEALPDELLAGLQTFRRSVGDGPHRAVTPASRAERERRLVELGHAVCALCLPDDSVEALASLLDGCAVGATIEVVVEADHPALLGLPFEALRLPDFRLLAIQPPVVMVRRPIGVQRGDHEPLSGPLKILVAVGAPDEGQSAGAVLDPEREIQNILDAVEFRQQPRQHENVQVRILEVGHPNVIGAAIETDAYHVLHLSCHGLPSELELEDEDGGAVRITARHLLEPIQRQGRPLPLVLLSAGHTGVHVELSEQQTASLAEALLQSGVPAVLAMLTAASRERPLASRALAEARKEVEAARQAARRRNGSPQETEPEYATASLLVAGPEHPLADYSLTPQPLSIRPARALVGPVPQLRIGDLFPDDDVWVHRWTAEGLARLADEAEHRARYVRAGRYRVWRVREETQSLDDGIEADRGRALLTGRPRL